MTVPDVEPTFEESGGNEYVLERHSVAKLDSDDDDYNYEEVQLDDDLIFSDDDEDLNQVVQNLKTSAPNDLGTLELPKSALEKRPEVVEDFIRNYLVKMNMARTLECFETEWYELKEREILCREDTEVVDDVYQRNQLLDDVVKGLRKEVKKYQDVTKKAKLLYEKLRKQRDFHRMHHKRVIQEKTKLIDDLRQLKKHVSAYEPTMTQLRHKYETAMKEKMLVKLERDRLQVKLTSLATEAATATRDTDGAEVADAQASSAQEPAPSPQEGRGKKKRKPPKALTKESALPIDDRPNPYRGREVAPVNMLTMRLTNTIKVHDAAVSSLSLHPKKNIVATASDDCKWKLWSLPLGELIMEGEGHKDWISDSEFHPSGSALATASGDCTVKLWNFATRECAHTFRDHTQAVWSLAFHDQGDYMATCSMDHTAKLWDLNTTKCKFTLRGHSDAVNNIVFKPYSNTVATCSGDKNIMLWDVRLGLCREKLKGHKSSINNVTYNFQGDKLASCDANGIVKVWDTRMLVIQQSGKIQEMQEIDFGSSSINRVSFDPSGTVIAAASSDGGVKCFNLETQTQAELVGHNGPVQSCKFHRNGQYLITTSSDMTMRIWS